MMLDRHLVYHNKNQIYGSQLKYVDIVDKAIGEKKKAMIVWPIEKASAVNKRRKKAGFTETVEENAIRLGIVYKVIKLKELAIKSEMP